MRNRINAFSLAAATLATLTACGGSDGHAADPKPPTSSAPAPTAAPTSSAPATSPEGELAIGQPYQWSGVSIDEKAPASGTTTVLGYSQPVSVPDFPTDFLGLKDPVWAAVDVKVCNAKGGLIVVSQAPWSLGFADDSRVESSLLSGPGLPRPEYPTDETTVKPGDCLRGKVPFVIEKGQRPDRVIYESSSTPEPIEWTVPKG